MHWAVSAALATICITPIMLLTGVAQRNFGIQADVTAALRMGGVTIGIVGWIFASGRGSEIVTISGMWIAIAIFSLTVGTIGNILLFQAFATAPNPGLALGIFNTNAVLAFLSAPLLAFILPKFFPPDWEFSWQEGGGVALVTIGIVLVVTK